MIRRCAYALGLVWLTASALPVAAAGLFAPPQGCHLEITVQNRGCTVSQHFRCDDDAPGDQRLEVFDREGPTYRSRIDAETRWLESSSLRSNVTDWLVEDARDHASFTTLLRDGFDSFDFWTVDDDGVKLRHIGRDELTGDSVEIDGVTLEITRFVLSTRADDGTELIRRRGQQFISRTQRRFYGGLETVHDWTGEERESDDSPVTFSFPGEPGFGATEPQFDCDLQLVGLRAALGDRL